THAHQRSTVLSVRRGLDWVLASALDGVPWQGTDDVQEFYLTDEQMFTRAIVYPPATPFGNCQVCLKVRLGYLLMRLDESLSAFWPVKTRASEGRERTRLRRIGKTNGIFARCLWERTPGAPPTWTP